MNSTIIRVLLGYIHTLQHQCIYFNLMFVTDKCSQVYGFWCFRQSTIADELWRGGPTLILKLSHWVHPGAFCYGYICPHSHNPVSLHLILVGWELTGWCRWGDYYNYCVIFSNAFPIWKTVAFVLRGMIMDCDAMSCIFIEYFQFPISLIW